MPLIAVTAGDVILAVQAAFLAVAAVAAVVTVRAALREAREGRLRERERNLDRDVLDVERRLELIGERLVELGELRLALYGGDTNAMLAFPLARRKLGVALAALPNPFRAALAATEALAADTSDVFPASMGDPRPTAAEEALQEIGNAFETLAEWRARMRKTLRTEPEETGLLERLRRYRKQRPPAASEPGPDLPKEGEEPPTGDPA